MARDRLTFFNPLCTLSIGLSAFAARLDHRAKLGRCVAPLLLLHTRHDGLIELSHAERNHEWAASREKRLVVFERGDHNSILAMNWDRYWSEVGAFFGRLGT